MREAFEKLSKILTLEQNQGYRNRSVIGGLESFAEIWQGEAEAQASDPEQVSHIREVAGRLRSYASMDWDSRAQTVRDLLEWSAGPDGAGAPAPHSVPEAGDTAPTAAGRQPAQAPAGAPPTRPAQEQAAGLDAPVSTLPGIAGAYEARLKRLGIATVGDLLYHFPHRYEDYRTLKPINRLEYGEETTIVGVIWETATRQTRSGVPVVSSIIADASGTIEAVWFNQPYLARQLRAGRRIVVSGKVDEHLGRLTLQSPAWEPLEKELIHTARLVPVYPLTSGLTARWVRRMTKRLVDYWSPRTAEYLPAAIRQRAGLMGLGTALQQIHFPDSLQSAEEARRRLCFDELFLIQLGLMRHRHRWQEQPGVPMARDDGLLGEFLGSLPYQLTDAQSRSLGEVLDDLARTQPMSRLLQGDVGSGKTVVAAAAMLMAAANQKQAALMVPTEILAEQHFRTLTALFESSSGWGLGRPLTTVLLTGSLPKAERTEAYAALSSGKADIVVGTHALIQKQLRYSDLGLIVVDEQHRFGVIQRATLRGKGASPHVLVMSATPIPRSLALTLYGDLDISVLDEVPPGRLPIETRWIVPGDRERAYSFLRSQVTKGRQAFILYPLVEEGPAESTSRPARAAVEEFERLRESVFPDLRLGLLHGRMKGREKDEVMARFRDGELDMLVATSVIEVGIDVPNATVILIEGADRFGLAQIHQFRGRVGRGPHSSYCLLIADSASPDDPRSKATWERLKTIEETQDGFVLAEKDLELRGPGDFFGVRQSGLPTLRLARISDLAVLELARSEAQTLYGEDPDLGRQEHRALAERLARFWQEPADVS